VNWLRFVVCEVERRGLLSNGPLIVRLAWSACIEGPKRNRSQGFKPGPKTTRMKQKRTPSGALSDSVTASAARQYLRSTTPLHNPRFDPPPYATAADQSDRSRELRAAEHRRRISESITRVAEAIPSALPDSLRALRYARESATEAIALGGISSSQSTRTERQLAHPLTLTDYVEASQLCERNHRPPDWFTSNQDRFDRIDARIESLAGLVRMVANRLAHRPGSEVAE
jgi:hypothetical protein